MRKNVLPEGKLPSRLLGSLLAFTSRGPEIIVGAAPGEDAAVVKGCEKLVVTADPITFTAEDLGIYGVEVNCNDVVAMGGEPRFLTTTLFLPPGTTESRVRELFRDIRTAGEDAGLLWIGGHTEVTSAVNRIVLSAQVIGFLDREPLTTDGAEAGHRIVMTKWAGLEGSTLMAREFSERAREALGKRAYQEVLQWLRKPGIGIRGEGRILRDLPLSSAHDPTEGGVATGLHEIAERSGVGMRIQQSRLAIRRETVLLCREWDLDPLGLLSSGVMLFTAKPEVAEAAVRRLQEAGIPASDIGMATAANTGIELVVQGGSVPLPEFERDELVKARA